MYTLDHVIEKGIFIQHQGEKKINTKYFVCDVSGRIVRKTHGATQPCLDIYIISNTNSECLYLFKGYPDLKKFRMNVITVTY